MRQSGEKEKKVFTITGSLAKLEKSKFRISLCRGKLDPTVPLRSSRSGLEVSVMTHRSHESILSHYYLVQN